MDFKTFRKLFIRAIIFLTVAFIAFMLWSYFSASPAERRALEKIERQRQELKRAETEARADSLLQEWTSDD